MRNKEPLQGFSILFQIDVELCGLIGPRSFGGVVKPKEMSVGLHVNNAIGDDWSSIHSRAEIGLTDEFGFVFRATGFDFVSRKLFTLGSREDGKVTVFVAGIDFAVRDERRTPHVSFHVVDPIKLAGLG